MNYQLKELIDSNKLQNLLNDLSEELAIAVSIIDTDGNVLAASGWKKFCTKFHHSSIESFKKCRNNYQKVLIKSVENNEDKVGICPHGLSEYSLPININKKQLGNVFVGQILLDKPDLVFFRKQAKKYYFDEESYIAAVSLIPVISKDSLNKKLSLIKNLTEIIAENGLKHLMEIESGQLIKKSEEKYRLIFENATEGIYQTTPEGQYISVNPAFAKMLGYKSPKEINAAITDIDSRLYAIPEERENLKNLIAENGFVNNFLISGNRVDGVNIRLSINAHAVYGDDGKIKFIEGTCEDITERFQYEEKIKQELKKWNSTFDSMNDAICLLDTEGNVLQCNKIMFEMFNLTEKGLKGKRCHNVVHGTDGRFESCPFNEMLVTGRSAISDIKIGERYFSIKVDPVKDINGNITGGIHILRDITQRKITDKKLIESEEKFSKVFYENPSPMALSSIEGGEYIAVNKTFLNTF